MRPDWQINDLIRRQKHRRDQMADDDNRQPAWGIISALMGEILIAKVTAFTNLQITAEQIAGATARTFLAPAVAQRRTAGPLCWNIGHISHDAKIGAKSGKPIRAKCLAAPCREFVK